MNKFEQLLVRFPGRGILQRRFEARQMLSISNPLAAGNALEVGCGTGTGTEIILESFNADHVDAFDLDQALVKQATRRLAKYGDCVHVGVGDVTVIDAEDATYDTVFDFAIIHHVPSWQEALEEIYRVLKPGGRFYVEEVYDRFILHPLIRKIFVHPQENRFNHIQLIQGLENVGFENLRSKELLGCFGWIVADKPQSDS